jgi:SAM-dependent methyltransferase
MQSEIPRRDLEVYGRYWRDHPVRKPSSTVVRAIQWLNRSSGTPRRVADIGCGTGRHVLAAAAQGTPVVGVDRHPEALLQARRACEGYPGLVQLLEEDAVSWIESQRAAGECYGLVVAFDVLHHLSSSRQQFVRTAGDLWSIVADGGQLVVTLLCDITYGEGDWPQNRTLFAFEEAKSILQTVFPAPVAYARDKRVDIDNTPNFQAATNSLVMTTYAATRLIRVYQR